MGDAWYEIANMDHFWVRRRFEVLHRLAGDLVSKAVAVAEIGCGNGLLQMQVEERYGKSVVGYDLNEHALKQNVSAKSPISCYDIFERRPELRQTYDLIFLFDVLEHIREEAPFLDALKYHLAPGGHIVLNVPAGQWAFSTYDTAVGHVRRYSNSTLRSACKAQGLSVKEWTYWGMPLVPVLFLRKIWLNSEKDESKIISKGLDSRSKIVDRCLLAASRCELVPQKIIGTSLMAVIQPRL